jgi:hypothetical protein
MNVLPLSLLRIFLTQVVLTLVLSLTISDAHAQRRGGGNGGGRGGNGPHGPHGPNIPGNIGSNFLSINKYMYDNEKINLSNQLDLQNVSELLVSAQSNSHNSKIVLRLNGQKVQTMQLSQYSNQQSIHLPMLQFGDKLVMVVRGSAFVDSVQAIKQYGSGPGHGGQNERLIARLHGQFTQSTTLQVRKLIAEQNGRGVLMGKNLKKVVLVASSARGRAQATLIINGQPVGYSQTIPTMKTKLVFDLQGRRNIIGQKVKSVQIEIRGRAVTLFRVATVLKNQGGHGGYNRSLTVSLNQSFMGSQRVSLAQILGRPRIDMNAPVNKLIINTQGHGNIMLNAGGMRLGSIIAGGRYGSMNETVHVNGSASVNDIMMRVSGRLTIKSITVELGHSNYFGY